MLAWAAFGCMLELPLAEADASCPSQDPAACQPPPPPPSPLQVILVGGGIFGSLLLTRKGS
jgi:hypothetical protein